MDRIDEAERGYDEALAAIEADDLMLARMVTTAAIHLAWSASRRKEVDTISRLQELLRRIEELESRSDPLTMGDQLADLVRSCESFCVAGCCGRDAFNLAAVEPWIRESGRDAAVEALGQLDSLLASLASREAEGVVRVLWSAIFEEALTAGTWKSYLATWRPLLESGIK